MVARMRRDHNAPLIVTLDPQTTGGRFLAQVLDCEDLPPGSNTDSNPGPGCNPVENQGPKTLEMLEIVIGYADTQLRSGRTCS